MNTRTNTDNMLYELAQTVASSGKQTVAVALRKLAREGYTSLDEVDSASDWTLLSIPGIGVKSLEAIRGLTRLDWKPPSPPAIKATKQLLVAARFALRFWPPETLISLIEGSATIVAKGQSHESRWAMELFSKAAHDALEHCAAEDLIQAIWQTTSSNSFPENPRDAGPSGF